MESRIDTTALTTPSTTLPTASTNVVRAFSKGVNKSTRPPERSSISAIKICNERDSKTGQHEVNDYSLSPRSSTKLFTVKSTSVRRVTNKSAKSIVSLLAWRGSNERFVIVLAVAAAEFKREVMLLMSDLALARAVAFSAAVDLAFRAFTVESNPACKQVD